MNSPVSGGPRGPRESTVRVRREALIASDQRQVSESWPFIVTTMALVIGGVALHVWISNRSHASMSGDADFIAAAIFALDGAIVLGLLGVGGLAWILDRRWRRQAESLRHAHQEIERQAHIEAEQKRLTLLGTLAAGLAHELGQPLSVARVGIEGIHYLRQLGRDPTPEHLERTLSRVGMSLIAMTQTIEHLRSLSTSHSTETSPIDLATCVIAVLEDREQWLRFSDVSIDWQPPSQRCMALADASGIRLILVNLLRNAVEAVISHSADRRLVKVVVGPGPTLAVHDSGAGISAERIAHLFDPFQSTKGGAGRGVGLSLVKASAQRMGADVEVQSNVGSGTIFTVRFLSCDTNSRGQP